MNTYVVCMDSSWVRDSQMFDIAGLTDDELADIDMHSADSEDRWHDMVPTPIIAVIKAENEEEACKKAGSQMRYDHRCLYAIKVSG